MADVTKNYWPFSVEKFRGYLMSEVIKAIRIGLLSIKGSRKIPSTAGKPATFLISRWQ